MSSLLEKDLQVIDTMDLRAIYKDEDGNTQTMFSGSTTKSEIEQKCDKVDIYSGIGQNKTASLKTKKEVTLKGSIASFDLKWLSAKNGVEIDTASKSTYFVGQPISVSTSSITVTDAMEIIEVKTLEGKQFKLVKSEPSTENEVQVSGKDLTFHPSFTGTEVLATYKGTTTKENLKIVISGKAFPKSYRLIANTVIFDAKTEEICADLFVEFYKASLNGDYNLAFEMGKNNEIDVEFEILMANKLPDNTYNKDGLLGEYTITER